QKEADHYTQQDTAGPSPRTSVHFHDSLPRSGGGSECPPVDYRDSEEGGSKHRRAEPVANRQQQGSHHSRAENQARQQRGPPRSGESGLDHLGSGIKLGVPVAKTAGYTVTLLRMPCHCQITLAARLFWPVCSPAVANLTPAPFASVPAGKSSARAAAASPVALASWAEGMT